MDKKQRNEWLDLFAEAFEGVVVPRINAIEKRLTKVEERLSKVEERLSKVEERLSKVEAEILELKYEVRGLRNAENEQDRQLRNHEARLTTLESA